MSIKFCRECGAQLKPDAKFCGVCGTVVAQKAEEPVMGTMGENILVNAETIKKPTPWAKNILLSIGLFVCMMLSVLIYDIRNSTTREGVEDILSVIKLSELKTSDIISNTNSNQELAEWLLGQLQNRYGDWAEITESQLGRFLERSTIKSFLARKIAAYFDDVYSDEANTTISMRDVSKLLMNNSDMLYEDYGLHLPEEYCDDIANWVVGYGLLESFTVETIKHDIPPLFYSLHIGLSYYTMAVFILLALLCMIFLFRVNSHKISGATKTSGVVFNVLGAIFVILTIIAKFIPSFWTTICGGSQLISTIIGQVLYYNVAAAIVLLAIGIVLLCLPKIFPKKFAK